MFDKPRDFLVVIEGVKVSQRFIVKAFQNVSRKCQMCDLQMTMTNLIIRCGRKVTHNQVCDMGDLMEFQRIIKTFIYPFSISF